MADTTHTIEPQQIRQIILAKKLNISRIPDNAYKQFIDLADGEFAGDYGMTVKHLLDVYFGIINKGTEHIEMQIGMIEERLQRLESNAADDKEKKPVRKMLDGTVVKTK